MTTTSRVHAADTVLRQRWYQEGYYTDRTFADEVTLAARRFPNVGFVFASEQGQRRMTFPELQREAQRVASGLRRLGLRSGDVMAVQVPNRPELVIAYYAAFLAGIVIVPITHIYGPAEMSFILRESGAKALVVPDVWRSIDYLDRVARLTDTPALEHVVVIGDPGDSGGRRWQELRDGPVTEGPGPTSPDEVCAIIYTSGTTSNPKGVQHTHNTLLAEMRSVGPMLGMRPGESKLVPWPAGHVAGMIGICAGLVGGTDTVLMDRWDVDLAARLIEEHRCVTTSGTPLHIMGLLDAASSSGRDLSSLRYAQVGGANVPPELVERAEASGLVIARAYGSTEHPTSATHEPGAPVEKRAGTDGRPRFGDELKIVDDDGKELPVGAEGEIVTRGPARFIGYRDEALNAESFLPDGWFRTGDVGRLDADGYLTVTDRKKDIIIRGGENIASREVEDILVRHPAVREAAVVAAPDERYGERVAAFVILSPGQTLDLTEVGAHFAAAGVARQKTPEHLFIVSDLPRTPSGKVQKFELRRRLRACSAQE